MKRFVAFLLLIISPTIALGRDSCTNPTAYTIDRRCYVSDEMKKVPPANAVVEIIERQYHDEIYCSGTIIKHNEKLYIYTAAHCGHKGGDTMPEQLTVKIPDGRIFEVYKYKYGNVGMTGGTDDWAIYEFRNPPTDIPWTNFLPDTHSGLVLLAGYGSLRVMSDDDINYFRRKYLEYLIKNPDVRGGNDGLVFLSGENTINVGHKTVQNFVYNSGDYIYDMVAGDEELKVSMCQYNENADFLDCQGFHGDSGAGLFNLNGALLKVLSYGASIIGGKYHASTTAKGFATPKP